MQGRTELSSVQQRDVHKNTLSTGSGPCQAPSNARQFRPPRNEARLAHSTRVAVPRVPAARDYSRFHADMDDSDSGDLDYNPVADKVDSWEDHLDNLFEREEVKSPDTEVRRRDIDIWKVNVIENGVMTPLNITARQVFSLPVGRQIVLPLNSLFQATSDAGGMLSAVLGIMVIDFAAFLIHVRSWKHMTIYKEREYDRQIKVEDQKAAKKVILDKLGKIWKDTRGRLFYKFYDKTKSLDENVQHRCPSRINLDRWRAFLEYRFEEDTLEKCRTNTANRAKQQYTHVGSSKTLARRREEVEKRHGRFFNRGEMWTMVHKKSDGSYIHDDAQAEVIAEIKSRDASTMEIS
ncbi:hypothetical protein PIB30_045478 [Stylosanthes scabra]|uniref:Uncharacterized protein n=1 Tax=Stylosanthes scabra TaxID=79078 RepID=A0ABU6WJK2_9FABA|nr:hypothetical protein [Stylosanthes scabra]